MKVLIITVAGMSTRFSRSVGKPVIKCLYHNKSLKDSLLYILLERSREFDYFIIVGGYRYKELCETIRASFKKFSDRILLIENPYYSTYGSGYSLYLGLQKAFETGADEIVFAEGDLYFNEDDYRRVCSADKSVVTVNRNPILADKSVALYFDIAGEIRYIYDTGHNELLIKEPFFAIYNSGQVWKFSDKEIAKKVFSKIDKEEWKGTNLIFVEKYFRTIGRDKYELITLGNWVNCNTLDDFNQIQEY